VRAAIRVRHSSRRTEEVSVDWTRRYILVHNQPHPAELGAVEVAAFRTDRAVRGQVAASTQNQAFSAVLFLDRNGLEIDLGPLVQAVRARRPKRLLSRPLGEP
jgi:hypothetical protein